MSDYNGVCMRLNERCPGCKGTAYLLCPDARARIEDETARRIAEWLRGMWQKPGSFSGTMRQAFAKLAESIERGDWRK